MQRPPHSKSTSIAGPDNLIAQSPSPSAHIHSIFDAKHRENSAATPELGLAHKSPIGRSPETLNTGVDEPTASSNPVGRTSHISSWQGGGSSEPQSRPFCRERTVTAPPPSAAARDEAPVSARKQPGKRARISDPEEQKERHIAKRLRAEHSQGYTIDLSDLPDYQKGSGPASPLFFSKSPRARGPPLPPRFSSSEAGVRMMRKANMEDTSGVRTVKMARGSIHYGGTSPSRAMSTPSARYTYDRSVVLRGMSPDEKDAASGGLQAISQVGIIEYLEQDDRVIFIVDLANRTVFLPGPLQMIFVNSALKSYSSLLDMVRGRIKDDASGLIGSGTTATFPEFKAWVTSFVKNQEPMDVSLPAFLFAGVTWTCSTLKKRFRVISGSFGSGHSSITSNPPSAGGHSITTNLARDLPSARGRQSIDIEEPKDYFGDVQITNWVDSQTERHNSEVLASIETPAMPLKIPTPTKSSPTRANEEFETPPRNRAAESAQNGSTHKQAFHLDMNPAEAILGAAIAAPVDPFERKSSTAEQGFFDWTRLPISPALPRHIQFARSIDWASTAIGPIEAWPLALRSMCNLIMASPHPAAMYWGPEYVAIYNEPYILLAGQKHPRLMGLGYAEAWPEIWDDIKDSFENARLTGQSTMKDDDRLFLNRSGFLEETYFSWSIIPLVGEDGSVVGLYNPAFEKTRRKIAERRMLTLREVGERTASAREVTSFWGQVLRGLEDNEYDTPFVLLYSVCEDSESDSSSMHSNSILSAKSCVLEGSLPPLPEDHKAAPPLIDLKSGNEGFGPVFREAMTMDKPVLLETSNGTLDDSLLEGIEFRGFEEKPRGAVVCPIHPTTGDSIIGFLVMGINPRRPYDDDYNLFVQLLGRQLATSMASVVLFEEEIRRGQRAAKLAALDRIELSEQLAARTQEAVESETKFTRMAEFAPVGMFIADRHGRMTFTNETFHSISQHPKEAGSDNWMDSVHDDDKEALKKMWHELIHNCQPLAAEFRFKAQWEDRNGMKGERWVLGSAYPEKTEDGSLKGVFGSITNISQQKWAEVYQRQRMEEAVELKRQQTNFMDMTSHEMRNPLSAILQCADEISGSLLEFKANPGGYQIPVALLDSNIDAAQTIALCANHQTRIVSDVLTLSKLDSALLLVTPVDARPATIVQQAVKMFDGELQTADITMNFVIDKSFEERKIDWVRLDPSRLLQVLINLTTNAIKFTTAQDKRTITITLSAYTDPPSQLPDKCVDYIPARSKRDDITEGKDWGDGQPIYLHFSVSDTGKGLTESEKKLLFLRFSQANPKTHVRYGGSGLGLFISRELVELQGGEIGVSSESGAGSTFAFYVKARRSSGPSSTDGGSGENLLTPHGNTAALGRRSSGNKTLKTKSSNLATNNTSSESQDPGPALSFASGNLDYLRVLIVEDNLVNQRVLSKQLRNLGCTIHVANHGGECIDHLQKTKYWAGNEKDGMDLSIILMDLEMPVMDGLTCARKIREYQRTGEVTEHVPIIAVSANARDAHIESALAAGMDDVVSKPFRIPELIPKVEQLVRQYPGPSRADMLSPAASSAALQGAKFTDSATASGEDKTVPGGAAARPSMQARSISSGGGGK